MSDDTRLWMYRTGEARLFGHPDDVPASEGWQRFPVPRGGSASEAPRVSLPEPGPDRELTDRRSSTACRASD